MTIVADEPAPYAELLLGVGDEINLLDEYGDIQMIALSTDEGTSWGNPDTVDVEFRSFIQHGKLVETENWENRSLIIAIAVAGATMDETALNEKLLMRQLHRRNRLRYKPASATVRTVFQVLTSTLVPTQDDWREAVANEVIYQIRFTCEPFVHGEHLREIDALEYNQTGETTTVETVNAGSTGWEGYIGRDAVTEFPSQVVVSGAGAEVNTGGPTITRFTANDGYVQHRLVKTFPTIDTSVNKVLFVDWAFRPGWVPPSQYGVTVRNGPPSSNQYLDGMFDAPSPTDGYTRSYFIVPEDVDTMTTLTIRGIASVGDAGNQIAGFRVKRVGTMDGPPALSKRQQLRSLPVEGVMPTWGSITITAEQSLSEVMLYTFPLDRALTYVPASRRYMKTNSTPDVDRVSGARTLMGNTPVVWHVPVLSSPQGDYLLAMVARFNSGSNSGVMRLQLTPFIGAQQVGEVVVEDYQTADFYDYAAGGFQVVRIDTKALPLMGMTGPDAYVKIEVNSVDTMTADIDELYRFNMTIGQLTHVDAGQNTRVWVDSPDVSNNGRPAVLIGNNEDRSDARNAFPVAKAIDIHEFDPIAGVGVFTAVLGGLPVEGVVPPAMPVRVSFAYYDNYWYRVPPVVDQDT